MHYSQLSLVVLNEPRRVQGSFFPLLYFLSLCISSISLDGSFEPRQCLLKVPKNVQVLKHTRVLLFISVNVHERVQSFVLDTTFLRRQARKHRSYLAIDAFGVFFLAA